MKIHLDYIITTTINCKNKCNSISIWVAAQLPATVFGVNLHLIIYSVIGNIYQIKNE